MNKAVITLKKVFICLSNVTVNINDFNTTISTKKLNKISCINLIVNLIYFTDTFTSYTFQLNQISYNNKASIVTSLCSKLAFINATKPVSAWAWLAQSVERWTFNPTVRGSSPLSGSFLNIFSENKLSLQLQFFIKQLCLPMHCLFLKSIIFFYLRIKN